MMTRHDFGLRSRRLAADVLLGTSALLLALAAFTATTEPLILMALALLVGVALLLEPAGAAASPLLRQARSPRESETTSSRG
jgi:hypothetical protein